LGYLRVAGINYAFADRNFFEDEMKTTTKKLKLFKALELMENKYGENVCLLVYPDQSGRIVDNLATTHPYDGEPFYSFHNLDDLIEHLDSC
jgi:hypothetical protein